ncbi:MAG: hypothetical protein FWB88_08170 [Defluviitaleaceae bacterium]|nr:hypothetical protein [Defluviitaleaceae bacterium]MCL2240656.1 hypothetical protein [Defluviitaleaceae bacterium]
MPEFIDYSSRRGAIVSLLPKVHALLKELSVKDKLCGLEPPETLVMWRQKINPLLLDINRRFLFAMEIAGPDKREILGYMFYRYDGSGPERVYIEDMQVAWRHRRNAGVVAGLILKLEKDPRTKNAVFYGGERLRVTTDKELLANVGFKETFPDGWEPLGNLKEATGALRIRYTRSKT